ncbi:MAG: DUF2723 domain-containing protein, partial [Armatimonadota bacterium]|nr:DUF2723 domain-containing protein [Armatimonadota bacterium]
MATGVATAAFLLYAWCSAPTVTYTGDCGELIAASYRLGIPHPSGYPLYCLLGRLFASLVPFGEVGWRYNLFSALCGAITVGLVTATVHRLTASSSLSPVEASDGAGPRLLLVGHWPAIGTGLLLTGFNYLGTQCVIAEVYALNALLLAALFYCAVAWHQDQDWRWVYTIALLFGLALNVHLSCVYLLPGLFLYVIVQHRDQFQTSPLMLRRAVIALALAVATLALNVYLPLRARAFPEPVAPGVWWPMDWGHPADLPRWLAHVTARQYRHHMFAEPLPIVLGKLMALFSFILLQYLWLSPLMLWGALRVWKNNSGEQHSGGRWLGAALLLTAVLNIGVHINYDVGDYPNFFFPAYIVIAIWLGFGLQTLFDAAINRGARWEQTSPAAPWRWRLHTLAWMSLVGTVAVQWPIFVAVASFHGETKARDTALERAAAAENLIQHGKGKPSLLLLLDDALWSFWYAQYVLGQARGVDTPWGVWRNKMVDEGRLVDLVAKLQVQGPVAISQWDAGVDQRYPYVMLTESGNLCLASHRRLPPPAQPSDSQFPDEPRYAGGLKHARFRRTTLNRDDLSHLDVDDLNSLNTAERHALLQTGLVALKREELAAFEVDFATRFGRRQSAPFQIDSTTNTVHIGWIEVLIARRGQLPGRPAPRQGDYEIPPEKLSPLAKTMPPLVIFKQTRRLIVPLEKKSRTPRPGTLRAAVPLQMHPDAPLALYDVWTRLTTTPHDATTPWQRTDV